MCKGFSVWCGDYSFKTLFKTLYKIPGFKVLHHPPSPPQPPLLVLFCPVPLVCVFVLSFFGINSVWNPPCHCIDLLWKFVCLMFIINVDVVEIFFQVSMEVADGGKTYLITGLWDPTVRDLLVLNTETPKGRWIYINDTIVTLKYLY